MVVVVCEDDALCRKLVTDRIDRWACINRHADVRIQTFSSSEELLEQWDEGLDAGILFLDILFQNEMDGMQLARQIRRTDAQVPIVFITNAEAYAREGYTVCALRYLSKPVRYEDIAQCLDIAYRQFALSDHAFFILSDTGGRHAVRYSDILYFEAQSPYTLISIQNEAVPLKHRCRFSTVLQKLPQELFLYCHRSYIVNLIHVRGLKRTELLLSNGKRLPVSKTYADNLNRAFDTYYQEDCEDFHVDCV